MTKSTSKVTQVYLAQCITYLEALNKLVEDGCDTAKNLYHNECRILKGKGLDIPSHLPDPTLHVVTEPTHYKHPSGVECKDIITDLPYFLGSAIKYIWRAGCKDDPKQDYKKALECLKVHHKVSARRPSVSEVPAQAHRLLETYTEHPATPSHKACLITWTFNYEEMTESRRQAFMGEAEYILNDLIKSGHIL